MEAKEHKYSRTDSGEKVTGNVEVRDSKMFSRSVRCRILIDTLLLTVFWIICLFLVPLNGIWWFAFILLFCVHILAAFCLLAPCCINSDARLYLVFKTYGHLRLGVFGLGVLVSAVLFILAIICWVAGSKRENEIDSKFWSTSGTTYFVRLLFVAAIGVWFFLTSLDYSQELQKVETDKISDIPNTF